MPANYDGSQVGVPFTRVHTIVISYPDNGQAPSATLHQSTAVLLADGTVRKLDEIGELRLTFDLVVDGATPIPLVDPNTGAALGTNTSLNEVFLGILAVIRKNQLAQPE